MIQATAASALSAGEEGWPDIRSLAHFGRDYADSDDERAVRLREHPHGLDWFALAVPRTSMWELHAGFVVADGHASVGVHRSAAADSPPLALLSELTSPWDADAAFSEVAQEHQFNVVCWPVADVDTKEAVRLLLTLYGSLRELPAPDDDRGPP